MSGHRLDWRPAPLAHRLATVALLAGLAALLLSRPDLLLLAAPPVGVLAAGRAARRPRGLTVRVTDHPRRCFEGEPVEITVTARVDGALDEIAITLDHSSVFTAEITARDRSAASAEVTVVLSAGCWGRHPLPRVVVDCRSRYRTGQARVVLALGEIKVFPAGPPVRPRITTLDLPRRLGEHVARTAGSGVEFAGIRPYLPGDRVRDLNWKASGARGRPHVTTWADQRQAEIVLAVDTFTDLGARGRGTLDRGMRGAAAMATAYLRAGDRVGIVAFGGVLRWLAPGQGGLHFHRLAEAVMDVRNPHGVASDIVRVPRSALPPGALVIVFSPLLDDRPCRPSRTCGAAATRSSSSTPWTGNRRRASATRPPTCRCGCGAWTGGRCWPGSPTSASPWCPGRPRARSTRPPAPSDTRSADGTRDPPHQVRRRDGPCHGRHRSLRGRGPRCPRGCGHRAGTSRVPPRRGRLRWASAPPPALGRGGHLRRPHRRRAPATARTHRSHRRRRAERTRRRLPALPSLTKVRPRRRSVRT
ncbi:DUF58 domain-containing protein [Actinomadura formosensis]|uniref:DUF58 domain-containing protein n=1 Tax=Actinomadura formosensis TaxID=60706 RepID=UPI003D8EA5A5